MSIDLFNASYVPTIFIRNAELRAVEELPDFIKDQLTPIFCLKPYGRCEHLEKSIGKIEAVFGDSRDYFLDIDPFYEVAEIKRAAHTEFLELIDNGNGNQNWVNFFEDHPRAFPCIQVTHGDISSIRNQISEFTKMERAFLVRLSFEGNRNWNSVIDAVCEVEHTNFGFVIDLEWSRDLLSRIEWADRHVKRIVELKGDSIPIILSGSSFPDSFAKFENGGQAPLSERLVFNNLITLNNRARLVYGDWASSRCPTEPRPNPNPIPPRIDLPCRDSWEIFRVRDEEGGFQIAAAEALKCAEFPHDLDVWGTYVIRSTAEGSDNPKDQSVIHHHSRAAAVRINLHLYRQHNLNSFDPYPDTDDDFVE